MRVLMLHNYYQYPGGEDVSFESEARLLEEHGCQVVRFEESNDRVKSLGVLRTGARAIWSQESYKTLRRLLRRSQCDVMHVQNFFPLISPSAYYAARAEGVAVVQSLRNYRLACPVGTFFREGEVCEDCLGKAVAWPSMKHACYQNSAAASAVVAAMLSTHRLIRTWRNLVDVYIALNQFGRQKFIEAGIPCEKIAVKPNLAITNGPLGDGGGAYALFAGRLEDIKGVETLLRAWRSLGRRIPLKIAGIGPLEHQVRVSAKTNPGIDYLGQCSNEEVLQLLRGAAFAVVPSIWYEGFCRIIVEAFSVGTPVITSQLGTMTELIDDGRIGSLFRPGDADDLVSKVEWLLDHPDELGRMRNEVRLEYEAKYSPQKNFDILMEIYETAIYRASLRSSADDLRRYSGVS